MNRVFAIVFVAHTLFGQTKTLVSGQTMQLTAPAVTWSVTPPVGTVSGTGLYTAPATNPTQQSVVVSAIAGSDTIVSQSITLLADTITLPIEVVGPDGTSSVVNFGVPETAALSGSLTLSLQVHNLKYDTMISVRINQGTWTPVSTATVTLDPMAAAYGGIGGGFSTIKMTMPLPGTITRGANQIAFRFNGTDGRSSGFRVLAFNISNSAGNLIPASAFVWDDPVKWVAPSSSAADIAAGKAAFQAENTLHTQLSGPSTVIKASCSDCHTTDGRDLKYFNYSNTSIQARSVFHGLTPQQGAQIASYIRSLPTPAPGRPWNPPYQPGPGLDSQPVANWAAGAGIDAVLPSDAAMSAAMFPSGITAASFSQNADWNARETQLAFPLPDWNQWLPQVHPMDAWPDFPSSAMLTAYNRLRASLVPGDAATYAKNATAFNTWEGNYLTFMVPKMNGLPSATWTQAYASQVYSTALWTMVKSWEINQQFGLEGLAKSVFLNPKANSRAWRSEMPFLASPNMLHIPVAVFSNGKQASWSSFASAWYQVQLTLDDSEFEQKGATPIDWGYVYAKVNDLSTFDSRPQIALYTLWQMKGLQLSNNGSGPDVNWTWLVTDISRLTSPTFRMMWINTPAFTRTAIYQGLVNSWLAEVQSFTPKQFWNYYDKGSPMNSTQVPNHFNPDSPLFVDRVWAMIPRFRYYGVAQAQINQMAAWAQTVWPNGGWGALPAATCSPDQGDMTVIRCSSDK